MSDWGTNLIEERRKDGETIQILVPDDTGFRTKD